MNIDYCLAKYLSISNLPYVSLSKLLLYLCRDDKACWVIEFNVLCWKMASLAPSIQCNNENIVARYAKMVASLVGPICNGDLCRNGQIKKPSPQSTYNMTTDHNKTNGHSPTTRQLTGHNLRKTQSPRSLRPQYPPIYTLPT